ncbi:MAG: SHOCT domain-containing protein [Elusimicrobiota bacterium]
MKIINKYGILILFTGFLGGFVKAEEVKSARSIDDILTQSKFRQKIFTVGVVKKPLNFDDFIVSSDQGTLVLVRFKGIKQDLKTGDKIFVYGRHLGRPALPGVKLEIEAIEYALDTKTENRDALLSKYGVPVPIEVPVIKSTETVSITPVVTEAESTNDSSFIEKRLMRLDGLKQKGLISEDEYKAQRKRILESL